MKKFCVISTVKCNLNCGYCYDNTHDDSVVYNQRYIAKSKFSYETIFNMVEKLKTLNYAQIVVTGGEPFLNKEIDFWISATDMLNMPLRILTNATFIKKETLEKIEKHHVVDLSVSLGGVTESTHNKYRGGWTELIKNLDLLKEKHVKIGFSYVLSSESIDEIKAATEFAKYYNASLRLAAVSITQHCGNLNHLDLKNVSEIKWKQMLSTIDDPLLLRDLSFYNAFFNKGLKIHTCGMRTKTVVLDTLGNIKGCFFRDDILYGNILSEPFDTIMNKIPTEKIMDADCFGNHCLTLQNF